MVLNSNILVNCDCLNFLENLDDNSIILAYLDPPYNTSETDINAFHNYIGKVIQQVYRLLKPNGNLFYHIPVNSVTDYRLILNQVFQKQPTMEFVWKIYRNNIPQLIPRPNHEYILMYSKSDKYLFNPIYIPFDDLEKQKFNKKDNFGNYYNQTLFTKNSIYSFEWKGLKPKEHFSWQFNQKKMDDLDNQKKIDWTDTLNPKLKIYLEDKKGIQIGSTWDDIPFSIVNSESDFKFSRPTKLLERIILISSNENDWILDPFCGSGTSLVAAQNLNRKWIGCDNNYLAIDIVKKRLKKECNIDVVELQSNYGTEKYKQSYENLIYTTEQVAEIINLDDKITVFCEGNNAKVFNNLNFPKLFFLGVENSQDVLESQEIFIKIVTNSKYWGIRDRDFLSDNEIIQLKRKHRNYKILEFYCFENYVYHPDNIEELKILNYDKELYINEIIRQCESKLNEFETKINASRKTYREFKANKLGINRDKNAVDSILSDLKSKDINKILKYFSLKDFDKSYLNRFKNYSNLAKKITSTTWFKYQIKRILEI
ncbi:MAG: DNA methyltransferase [Mariniphaga sp.]